MKKIFGLCSLAAINSSALFLIYLYISTVSSTKVGNVLHIPFEASGMQLSYYFISLPVFIVLALLSVLHSYYFELKKSLASGILLIWFSYVTLLLYVDQVIHYSKGNNLLYYGSLIISFVAVAYIIYSTYCQYIQLIKSNKKI